MIQHTVTVVRTINFNEGKKTEESVIEITDGDRMENIATARCPQSVHSVINMQKKPKTNIGSVCAA